MSKLIPLTQNKFATVDDDMHEHLNQWKWCVQKSGYGGYKAVRACYCWINRESHLILMHRQIMSCPQNKDVDHRNHDTLNNQKYNLRICNRSQNMGNGRKRNQEKCSSQYKGVTWCKGQLYKGKRYSGKWMAQITCNYKHIYLGRFENETEAAIAYDEAALKYFGEYAKLNVA